MTMLEEAATQGFLEFWRYICKIWQTYKRYGDIVLEKDLEEGDEKFKPLFTESGNDDFLFRENVGKYWKENYHFVAGSYEELFEILSDYRQRKNAENSLSLLPETGSYTNVETKGYQQTYSIKEDLYKAIITAIKVSNLRDLILINYKKNKILTIHLSTENINSYNPIIISECKDKNVIVI